LELCSCVASQPFAQDDNLDIFYRSSSLRPDQSGLPTFAPIKRSFGWHSGRQAFIVHAYASFSKGCGAQASFIVHRSSFIVYR
jgi:hypothetical protein